MLPVVVLGLRETLRVRAATALTLMKYTKRSVKRSEQSYVLETVIQEFFFFYPSSPSTHIYKHPGLCIKHCQNEVHMHCTFAHGSVVLP